VRVCDELGDGSFGWIEDGRLRRCGHALVADGRVFLIDPFDDEGVEERARAAGDPAGVLQLLDRHRRDCAAFARRLGVPLHVLQAPAPFAPILLGTPPGWKEIALWWPERQVLVLADALGTQPGFRTEDERLGVHPLLRLIPPRRLAPLAPRHILVGHGEGVHDDATGALREALATSRRRLPAALVEAARAVRRSRTASK
jgi:hypothetical protein